MSHFIPIGCNVEVSNVGTKSGIPFVNELQLTKRLLHRDFQQLYYVQWLAISLLCSILIS